MGAYFISNENQRSVSILRGSCDMFSLNEMDLNRSAIGELKLW